VNRPVLRTALDAPSKRSIQTGRHPHRRLAAVVGLLAAAAVAGCSTQSPLQTLVPYQPADGVAASSGVVQARNLLLVAAAKGDPAYLSGSLINTSTDTITVSFASQEAAATSQKAGSVQLKSLEQLQIETITIPAVAAPPGALASIVMTTPAGQVLVSVPVLAPTAGSPYATMTPAPTTATPGSRVTSPVATPTTAKAP